MNSNVDWSMGRKTARQLAVSCITVGLDDKCFFHMGMAGQKDIATPPKWAGPSNGPKMGRAGTCHGPKRDRAGQSHDPKKGAG